MTAPHGRGQVVEVGLQGEDDPSVRIVASLATDLIGTGQSLANACITFLLLLLKRSPPLHHLQISLLRQYLFLRLTMTDLYSCKSTNPLQQHHMLLPQVKRSRVPDIWEEVPESITWLSQLSNICYVSIANDCTCPVSGEGVVGASSNITLDKVLYVPHFPINLQSINAITKQLYCFVSLFPFHCTF